MKASLPYMPGRLPSMSRWQEAAFQTLDEDVADESAFYLRVIDAVMNSEISIEEAAELG